MAELDTTILHELQSDVRAAITPPDKLLALRAKVVEFIQLQKDVDRLDEELKTATKALVNMARKELPDLFDECGMDRMGIPGTNVDVAVKPYYHANIKAEWPEAKREEGFQAVIALGGEDLVRVTLSIVYGPSEYDQAMECLEHLRKQNWFGNRHVELEKNVPWNTLTGFLRERVEAGDAVPLDKLGATVSRQCRVETRKIPRKGKK